MAEDRKTVGLTSKGRVVIGQMMEEGLFRDQIDAAKFALAMAVQHGVGPGSTDGTSTVWNVGSLDPDGELRQLLMAMYDDLGLPYKAVEHLINEGLVLIGDSIEETKTFDPRNFL